MTRGNIYKCLNWDVVLENITSIELTAIRSLAQEGHNYCRNPMDYRTEPWCYIFINVSGLLQISYEFCDIPICGRFNAYICTQGLQFIYIYLWISYPKGKL